MTTIKKVKISELDSNSTTDKLYAVVKDDTGKSVKVEILPAENLPNTASVGYIAVASDITGKKIKYVPVSIDDNGNVVITGNATINGTLTTINSETLQVKDKNIEIAKVDAPTDDTADSGGITLLGATNKTITWVKSKLSWVFNQAVEIAGDLNVIGTIKTNGTQISTSDLSDGADLVKGPTSSVANSIPTFADITGKLLKYSTGVTIESGNIVGSNTSFQITTNTADAADIKRLQLTGGGTVGNHRGGYINIYGNDFGGNQGNVDILAGNSTIGRIGFYTDNVIERMRIEKGGNIGIGSGAFVTASGTALGKLDISNGGIGLVVGADYGADTRTNATSKRGRITFPHYTNSEEPISIIGGATSASNNTITIGGGATPENAATIIQFYTAANPTTIMGTERMRITASGNVGIGNTEPSEKLHVIGNTLASGDSASATKTIGGKVRMEYDTATDTLEFNFI